MRFAIYSSWGLSLSWWKRLQDEGNEVLVYIEHSLPKKVGDGIVPKTANFAQWAMWGRSQPNTIFFFDNTGAGKKADALRKQGCLVVGGCEFFDKLEDKREWSEDLHKSLGILAPESKAFGTVSDAIKYAQEQGKPQVFKPEANTDCSLTYVSENSEEMIHFLTFFRDKYGNSKKNLMQEKLNGFALSTARWWNGRSFVGPYQSTIEHKKLFNNDKGPATGCQFNCVWFYQDEYPAIARELRWDKLVEAFRHNEAAPGIYDINALLNEKDGKPYFLESTPRLGYDSETTSQKGIKDLGKFLYNLAVALPVEDLFVYDPYMCSVKLSVPPYPYEAGLEDIPYDKTSVDSPVWGFDGLWSKHFIGYGLRFDPKMGLVSADPSGWLGLSADVGTDPLTPFDGCYAFLDESLEVPNLQYRTDAKDRVEEDLESIEKCGFDIR